MKPNRYQALYALHDEQNPGGNHLDLNSLLSEVFHVVQGVEKVATGDRQEIYLTIVVEKDSDG